MQPLNMGLPTICRILTSIFVLSTLVTANVEKVIFLGPEAVPVPVQKPTLTDLNLHTLTPANFSVRTELGRVFPSEKSPQGTETWLLLDGLTEGQRYELRVCWSAIEPTSFDLDVFELNNVWATPELIQSVADYSFSRQGGESSNEKEQTVHEPGADGSEERHSSVLLLRVLAAADYFTDNAELMRTPPPVLVDLILDPFLFNVLPRSLLPTVGYIVVVTVVTWFVARWVASSLRSVASSTKTPTKKTQ